MSEIKFELVATYDKNNTVISTERMMLNHIANNDIHVTPELKQKLESISTTGSDVDLSVYALKTELPDMSLYVSVDDFEAHVNDSDCHVSEAEKSMWSSKSDFDGNYENLTNKPVIPEAFDPSNLNASVSALEANKAEKSNVESHIALSDQKFADISIRIANIEKAITSLKLANVSVSVSEFGSALTFDDVSKDYIVTGELNTVSDVSCNSLELKDVTGVFVNTTGVSFTINTSELKVAGGEYYSDTQSNTHDLFYVKNAETVTFKDIVFTGKSYNTIMVAQKSTKYIDYLTIENCTFDEECKHINIWVAGWNDGAIVNIKNCNFRSCEQILDLSCFNSTDSAKKLTINIENCNICEYQIGDAYEGIICCESTKVITAEAFDAIKPFGAITINFKNVKVGCTRVDNDGVISYEGGTLITKDNFAMGTKAAGQLLYVYCAQYASSDLKNITYSEETKEYFPVVNVL